MLIHDMFVESIDRPINGVIQVDQDESTILEQELKEYVITTELKKHFMTFFSNYVDALTTPTTSASGSPASLEVVNPTS